VRSQDEVRRRMAWPQVEDARWRSDRRPVQAVPHRVRASEALMLGLRWGVQT
jgi:hypothetical protein